MGPRREEEKRKKEESKRNKRKKRCEFLLRDEALLNRSEINLLSKFIKLMA
jgi:hypothetical protein